MLTTYSIEVEKQMLEMFNCLSEKDKRLYAGAEALKFNYGGISYMARLFSCSRNTIKRGIIELGKTEIIPEKRERKAGGGRKQIIDKQPDINGVFLSILKDHTVGSHMDKKNLTKADITAELAKKGFKVSRNIVKKLLEKYGNVQCVTP
jgi:L-2-hydroxyglutarate oxidase LhgO